MKRIFALVVVALVVTSVSALAGRAQNQRRRIQRGVRSGQLTREEAKGLRKDGRAIREQKRAARGDGKITPEERQKIREAHRARSRKIHQEKHDGQTRPAPQGIAVGEPHPATPPQSVPNGE